MILANGAQPILAGRQKGVRPAEMLIVSMIGRTSESNHTVYANAGAEYDWRWAVGLDICLYVNSTTKWRDTLLAIAKARPRWLGVYNVDQFKGATASYLPRADDIEKPKNQWRYVLDFLPWTNWQNETYSWEG